MNRILGIVMVLALLGLTGSTVASTSTFLLPGCLQDQYGNQYSQLIEDLRHNIVTGVVIPMQQGCTTTPWTMVGSWTVNSSGQTILELTVANNSGTGACTPIYKLKGPYPGANWFYDTGLQGNQEFKYATCSPSSPVVPDTGAGGAYGVNK